MINATEYERQTERTKENRQQKVIMVIVHYRFAKMCIQSENLVEKSTYRIFVIIDLNK